MGVTDAAKADCLTLTKGNPLMGSLSNYAEDAAVNHVLNTAYTPVPTVFLAFCIADPTDAATGAAMNETANLQAYARTACPFGASGSRIITANADVVFPQATGNYAAPVTHWTIVDSATYGAGNVLCHGAFNNPFQPVTGNTPTVPTALQEVYVQFDPVANAGFSDYFVTNFLDLMFRNQAFASTAGSVYMDLSTTVLNDQDVANTDYTAVTGAGYPGRLLVDANGGTPPVWSTVAGGVASNVQTVSFGTVGAGDWTQLVSLVYIDSVSGAGNILAYDNTVPDQTPQENDIVEVPAGQATITIT